MFYTVYILYSEKDKKLYTGCTSNFDDRLKKHFSGNVKATALRRPLVVIHKEIFVDKAKAFNRERFLKSLWGSREKRNIKKKFLEGLKK